MKEESKDTEEKAVSEESESLKKKIIHENIPKN